MYTAVSNNVFNFKKNWLRSFQGPQKTVTGQISFRHFTWEYQQYGSYQIIFLNYNNLISFLLYSFIIQKEEVEELISAIDINNPKSIAAVEELTQIYCDCLKYIYTTVNKSSQSCMFFFFIFVSRLSTPRSD